MYLKSPAETLSAIRNHLAAYDIEGYADHTLNGFGTLCAVEIFRGDPRSGYLNLGKGFGLEAALASGYMEAIEMCTMETPPQVPLVAISDVAWGAWVYDAADRRSYRAAAPGERVEGPPLIAGLDLLTGEDAYGFVHDHFLLTELKDDAVHVSTNGLASGNTVAEARLHAVYEIIERHVAAASLQNRQTVSILALSDLVSPLRDAMVEVDAAGMRAEFFLLGTMLGVTVMLCALFRGPDGADHADRPVHFGWGAHHDSSIAMSKALAEAYQACATRSACMQGNIPPSRMKGGLLMPAEYLNHLKSGSTDWETLFHLRLRQCATRDLRLDPASDTVGTCAENSLNRLLDQARDAGISHVFSWSLSPTDRPFSVVKCVIPEFDTLF